MRILFVVPRFPYPALKGDSLRIYHQLRVLSREHEITLLSMAESEIAPDDFAKVAALCESVHVVRLRPWQAALNLAAALPSRTPLQVQYYNSGALRKKLTELLATRQFDAVHATLVRMLPYVWNIQNVPIVVDLVDSQALNLADRRQHTRGLKRLAYEMEYRRIRRYEKKAVKHFTNVVVTSSADREALDDERAAVLPNGVDADRFAFAGAVGRDQETLVFTGNMGYHPNEEAVLWFAAAVWPPLRALRPRAIFQIVGTNPSPKVRTLANVASGIQVLGRVPEVSTFLQRATIAVCPMRSGSGIQNKVLEAMSAGAPVVATSIANRGVHGLPGNDLVVVDDALEFANALDRVLGDAALRAALADAGRALVEREYRWEAHVQALCAIYARGAEDEIRTRDPRLGKAMLYH